MQLITNFKNSHIYREKVHNLIPGGAHTYSKGDDQFPTIAPAAIKKGKGGHVWDIDDNKYLDCSMGLSAVSLGHAYEPVLEKVKRELDSGVNFQRPSYIELEMAEAFLNLVPGHDMIKFAKNGSIVTTAAVKLARAFTGRKYVVFPSDHPFYSYDDWFISKTSCSFGIPGEVTSLSLTYNSQNLSTLEELFQKYPQQIACIITEPIRFNDAPNADKMKQLQSLCKKNGTLLIFDEMVSGFKVDFPGAITKYEVIPDMATWGKGIANGFSFCALTGKKEIMELGGIRNKGQEKLFLISTTHGGETHTLAAGLATINEFKTKNVISHNHSLGKAFIQKIKTTLVSKKLQDYIDIYECEWMPVFGFKNQKKEVCNGMRTLMLQEMIKRGVLFQGIFVPCFSHTVQDIDFFNEAFSDSLKTYTIALEKGYEPFLEGEPTRPVFRKYI